MPQAQDLPREAWNLVICCLGSIVSCSCAACEAVLHAASKSINSHCHSFITICDLSTVVVRGQGDSDMGV